MDSESKLLHVPAPVQMRVASGWRGPARSVGETLSQRARGDGSEEFGPAPHRRSFT
jgi:hypothetical protein